MAKPTITRFETFIGNEWRAWVASDTVKITLFPTHIKIVTEPKEATADQPGHDRLTTFFNTDVLPAYTIA